MMDHKYFFYEYYDNAPDIDSYLSDCIDYLHGISQEMGIEFDGYFQSKWENSADTITQFNQYYFDNLDRKKLYVFLSALYKDEVYTVLKDCYSIANLPEPTQEVLKLKVNALIDLGVRF